MEEFGVSDPSNPIKPSAPDLPLMEMVYSTQRHSKEEESKLDTVDSVPDQSAHTRVLGLTSPLENPAMESLKKSTGSLSKSLENISAPG